MEETRPGFWKAMRILAVLLLVAAILLFVLVAFTFLVSFFIGGQIISDGTGLMRLFLKATSTGQRPIIAAKFGLAGMPALAAAACSLVYSCLLVHRLRKHDPAKGSSRGGLIAMRVLAALTIVLPVIVWLLCAKAVAGSGFFTMPFPLYALWGVVLLVLAEAIGRAEKAEPQRDVPAET